MNFKIFKYRIQNNPFQFTPQNVMMTAWLTEKDWNIFLAEFPDYLKGEKELFVKIVCKKYCSEFVIYRKLSKLIGSIYEEVGNNLIWLAKETMPLKDMTDNKIDDLEVTIVDVATLPKAETISIKLKENDVERWSESEFEKALSNVKIGNRLAQLSQNIFFTETRKAVVAEIVEINGYHSNEDYDEIPFILSKETEIKLIGKPVNPQQTIDFSRIGGQNATIRELREIIQLPMNFPEYFEKFDVNPPKGILLYGPPGNGKTMIAKALAETLGASFINIDLSDALQKYKGVGEHNLDKKFDEAENKRNAVIFIDEIDAIASIRTEDSAGHEVSLVGKLLSLMDGIKANHRIFVIGATNRINAVDPALRRPGRFDKELEVPLPDVNGRKDILSKYIKLDRKGVFDDSVNDEYIEKLAKDIDGYSGADISALYREATMAAIREQLEMNVETGKATMKKSADDILVSQRHFENAKERVVATSKRGDINKS